MDFCKGDIVVDDSEPIFSRIGVITADGSWEESGNQYVYVAFPDQFGSYFADRLRVIKRAYPIASIDRLQTLARALKAEEDYLNERGSGYSEIRHWDVRKERDAALRALLPEDLGPQ